MHSGAFPVLAVIRMRFILMAKPTGKGDLAWGAKSLQPFGTAILLREEASKILQDILLLQSTLTLLAHNFKL